MKSHPSCGFSTSFKAEDITLLVEGNYVYLRNMNIINRKDYANQEFADSLP
jgi:hypothetical protein